jgi:hypothetical protein
MEGGGGMRWMWWWWWGPLHLQMQGRRGLGAKSHKYKCDGLIWGAPCQMVMEGDGGRWCSCAVEVVVIVGLCVHKCEAGGGWGPNLTNKSMMAQF